MDLKTVLVVLECTLINTEEPDYISITWDGDFINILLTKKDYKNYSIAERINGVYELLKFEHEEILEEFPIVVECLCDAELTELMKERYL